MLTRILLVSLVMAMSAPVIAAPLPDFAAYKDVKQKKKAFFDFIHERLVKVNAKIMQQRTRLVQIKKKPTGQISDTDRTWVKQLAEEYRVKMDTVTVKSIDNLLMHVDLIPASLALAQAANESAWGTSRFAKKANNLFGQWCFSKGCGIVPKKRGPGQKHEVRKFDDAAGSVAAYAWNLNTNRAYRKLREIRAGQRAKNVEPTGHALAAGLINYSQRREEYVKELRSMIRYNKLATYSSLPK